MCLPCDSHGSSQSGTIHSLGRLEVKLNVTYEEVHMLTPLTPSTVEVHSSNLA